MMKKKIIFGSLLAVFLMVMLPSACAVELIEKKTDNSGEPLFILTFLILLLKAIRTTVWIVGFVILRIIRDIIGNNTTACIIS